LDRQARQEGQRTNVSTITDDAMGRQVPDARTHRFRVRMLGAAIARRILAIPPNVSAHSRKIRIAKVREKLDWFEDQMSRTVIFGDRTTVIVRDNRERDRWGCACADAWAQVADALEAGDDLAAFLFPAEAAS
jgi:hypothetical protein